MAYCHLWGPGALISSTQKMKHPSLEFDIFTSQGETAAFKLSRLSLELENVSNKCNWRGY